MASPTRYTKLAIGAISTLVGVSLGANVAGYFAGNVQVTNKIDFPTTSSGIQLTLNANSLFRVDDVTCTATGGVAAYDTCLIKNPFSGSGVIQRVAVEFGNNHANGTLDCGLIPTEKTGTGSFKTTLINNASGGTGALAGTYTTATQVWHGGEYIKCGSLTDVSGGFTARLRVWSQDLFGE